MRLSLITLHTADLEKSLRFYQGLLEMKELRRMELPNMTIVFLGHSEEVQLELICDPTHTAEAPTGFFSLGFDVENIEATLQKLTAAGVKPLTGTQTVGGGTKLTFVEGPNGEQVELIQYA